MLPKIIDSGGFNAVVNGRYGFQIYNKNDVYVGRAMERYGEYSELEVELFRQICKPGDIAIEVGANLGMHTLALARMVGDQGRVFAFEPQRIVFQTLCGSLALNSIANVEAHQLAVSNEPGEVLIPDIRYDVEGNYGAVEIERFTGGRPIQVVTLDAFLSEIGRLKLLKIDVEGMEQHVIEGAKELIAKHKPAIYLENDRIEKSPALIEAIQALGYRAFWHLPTLYNKENFAGDSENIYPGTVSVNMLCFPQDMTLNLKGFQEATDPHFHPMARLTFTPEAVQQIS